MPEPEPVVEQPEMISAERKRKPTNLSFIVYSPVFFTHNAMITLLGMTINVVNSNKISNY
jgi:hypothetical protein